MVKYVDEKGNLVARGPEQDSVPIPGTDAEKEMLAAREKAVAAETAERLAPVPPPAVPPSPPKTP